MLSQSTPARYTEFIVIIYFTRARCVGVGLRARGNRSLCVGFPGLWVGRVRELGHTLRVKQTKYAPREGDTRSDNEHPPNDILHSK